MHRTSEHPVLAAARRLVSPAEDGTDGIFALVHPSAKRQLSAAMAGTLRDHASMLEGGQVLGVTEYGDRSATVAVMTPAHARTIFDRNASDIGDFGRRAQRSSVFALDLRQHQLSLRTTP